MHNIQKGRGDRQEGRENRARPQTADEISQKVEERKATKKLRKLTQKAPHSNIFIMDWGVNSTVKTNVCSSKGFNSQHPHGNSRLSITPVPGI